MDGTAPLSTKAAAALLKAAHASGQPVAPLRDRLSKADLDSAYAIQEFNTRAWLAEGRRLVGRKIGLTSLAVQAQLGVDQPDFGMLFADMAVGDGELVALGRLIQPKVEAEVALVIGRDLTHERHTYADIIGAIEYALPAIEIVDSRIEKKSNVP
jgi:2-keto-4-pentenoate hydratase